MSTSLLHLSVRKGITDTAVSTTVVNKNIRIHPGVTQVVTQVVQPTKLGLTRYRMAKNTTTITDHPKLGKPCGIAHKRLF